MTDVPEVADPEVSEPEVSEPEASEPEASEPEVSEPEASEPEVSEPSPFDSVRAELRPALIRRGITELTSIQRAVLAEEVAGRNLRLSSQTGSGKTAALGFVLAEDLISHAKRRKQGPATGPVALIITPTRELAAQVRDELDWLFADIPNLETVVVTGGTNVGAEQRQLRRRQSLLVGTPGRILDHLRSGALHLDGVAHVVLDEADQMLDLGFREELEAIVDQLPAKRASHLVSATFPGNVRRLADSFQHDALHLEGTRLGAAHEDIDHIAQQIRPNQQYAAIVNNLLVLQGERCLVFVRKRTDAAEVAELLAADGFTAMPLSGDLPQTQRTRTLNLFRHGLIDTLVATDVAARGIDVPDVAVVLHVDMPTDAHIYTHRSGRTGRAGHRGRSILLVPHAAERRVRRVLREAKVTAHWGTTYSAKSTRKAVAKRFRRKLGKGLETAEAPPEELQKFAARLLARYDPEVLVTHLLGLAEPPLPCEPKDVDTKAPAPRGPGRRLGPSRFIRFFINWGAAAHLTPAKLLAHVCRRGDVTSGSIGSMDIGPHSSTFEVAADVAAEFERRARKPDSRDPHVHISRFRAPRFQGPRGGQGPGRRPSHRGHQGHAPGGRPARPKKRPPRKP